MMQVFQRGVDESLILNCEDGDMKITVLEILPTCVRLGITDPNNFPEYWEETLHLCDADAEDEGSSLDLALAL
jgi:sRNA-binding carbon storage regulator CsrA